MKRLLIFTVLGVLALVSSGCSMVKSSVREDITDLTQKDTYRETAKAFLSDEVMLGLTKVPDSSRTQQYCQNFSSETSQKIQDKLFKVASFMDKHGFSGFSGNRGLISKPKIDFGEKFNFCNNFFAFSGSLTANEMRKFLMFLGEDYFSANWMREKFADGGYPQQMKISAQANEMVQDKGFAGSNAAPGNGLQNYVQNRIDWQSRNAGIAMLGWFKKVDKDKELGLVNPTSMDELKRKYSLYRDNGFTWYTSDMHELRVRGVQKNLLTFVPKSTDLNKEVDALGSMSFIVARADDRTNQVIDVWGAIQEFSVNDNLAQLQQLFERFKPGSEVREFYSELSKKEPDLGVVKKIAVESVADDELEKTKGYASWLANGKQPETAAGDKK